jgi:hypothetical protein
MRGRVWGSHFASVKLLVETSETCTQKKSTTHNTRDKKQKMYFGTRSDHNKDCEDLCKNRKIDETQKQSWRKQGPTTTLLAGFSVCREWYLLESHDAATSDFCIIRRPWKLIHDWPDLGIPFDFALSYFRF